MNTQEPTTYNLGSNPLVCAPGVFVWLQSLHLSDPDKAESILAQTWSLPPEAASAVMNREVPYEIDHDKEVVSFTYPPQEQ